jgi:hypothetical protein
MGAPKAIPLKDRVDAEAHELGSNLPENREPEDDYLSGWALLSVITALMFGAFMLALDNTVLCMYFTICVPATDSICKQLPYLASPANSAV